MEKYYKILRNGMSCHGGDHTWEPGVTYAVDEVIPCEKGFHACRLQDLSLWITWDMEIWEIELGEVVVEYNKVVGRTAKLTRRLGSLTMEKQVEFAKWCEDATIASDGVAAYAARAARAAAAAAAAVADAAARDNAAAVADAAAAAAAAAAVAAADWAAAVAAAAAARADAARADAARAKEAQGRKILELLT